MLLRSLLKVAGTLLLCFAVAATASAQYGGGTGGGTGTGGTGSSSGYGSGSGKAIGIGVGVAAGAAVGIALLVHHHHAAARREASVVGCTQSFMNGLSLMNENDNQMYLLLSKNTPLQPGELVELKGVIAKEGSGTPAFRVQGVVTNYGTCGTAAALRKEPEAEKKQAVLAAK